MKKEIQIFSNDQFGQVRAIEINGTPWFVGKDVAEALGYKNTKIALQDNVDDEDRGVTKVTTSGGMQKAVIINESGLYALVFGSRLPKAKEFKHWVTSDVLPTLRKTGTYTLPTDETKSRMLATREANIQIRKAQLLFKVSEKCGIESYKQVLHSHITLMLTGQELLPLPRAEKTTYTASQIGEMLNISANMVGKLANRYNLKTQEYGELVWDKSPYSAHQCQTFRYYIAVVAVLQKLIAEVA